jgi:hypothetical protein
MAVAESTRRYGADGRLSPRQRQRSEEDGSFGWPRPFRC